MAIERITTYDLLIELNNKLIEPFIHDEILLFFQENFDFNLWQWKCEPSEYREVLNCYYTHNSDYEKTLIYCNSEEKNNLLKALAWIFDCLKNEQSDKNKTIQALHLSIIVPKFWECSFQAQIKFSKKVQEIVIGYIHQSEIEIKLGYDAQIYKEELIPNLLKALETCDWVEIEGYTHQLEAIFGSFIFSNASNHPYRLLIWHNKNEVVAIINEEMNPTRLLVWISYIPNELSSEFITQTTNNLAKFLLLIKKEEITVENQIQLSNLWENLNDELLDKWFSIFNENPIRFPHLQLGIGKFLSTAKSKQQELFIDTVSMNNSHSDNVTKCIDIFIKNADSTLQSELCNTAFKKWIDWKPDNSYKVFRSSIDKLVVLYFQYNCNQEERNNFISENIHKIITSHSLWFKNRSDFDKYIYEIISKIQPVCTANHMLENSSKSFEDCQNLLFTPDYFDNDLRWKSWITFD